MILLTVTSYRSTGAACVVTKKGWFTTPGRWDQQMKDKLSSSLVFTAGDQRHHMGCFTSYALWFMSEFWLFTGFRRRRTLKSEALTFDLLAFVPLASHQLHHQHFAQFMQIKLTRGTIVADCWINLFKQNTVCWNNLFLDDFNICKYKWFLCIPWVICCCLKLGSSTIGPGSILLLAPLSCGQSSPMLFLGCAGASLMQVMASLVVWIMRPYSWSDGSSWNAC